MELLKAIFTSKKALTALSAVTVVVLQHFGIPIDEATVNKLLLVASAYIIGQGIADATKEAEKEKKKNATT